MIYTSSGKQALSLICDYLLRIGYLKKKQSEILVPKFMGNWIYSNYNQSVYNQPNIQKIQNYFIYTINLASLRKLKI